MNTRPTLSVFSELLGSITERSLNLIDPGRTRAASPTAARVIGWCHDLLSSQGEATGIALAWQILDGFDRLDPIQKSLFFRALANDFGPDTGALTTAAQAYLDQPGATAAVRLNIASEPRRQELIRRLNQAPDGTRRLVAMRDQLLAMAADEPELAIADMDFVHLLGSWFNRGFLELQRIDWDTPASVLEKIIAYEAVHEISGWDDLRRRIDLPDRRLYAFFHPRLPSDPLIFVEVALTLDVPATIGSILSPDREELAPDAARTAVFYSISNCQSGLRGISFGSFLIKQVVETLKQELPGLRDFVTLSPIPGFARWLRDHPAAGDLAANLAVDDPAAWLASVADDRTLQQTMSALAATYLTVEKDDVGRPLDPVARFHLGNGAVLDRVNWLANPSAQGLAQSHSLMVNYRYKLEDIEKNHEAFANTGAIATSGAVTRLAKAPVRIPSAG